MYVWVDTTQLSGELLKAAQGAHIQKWLQNMQYAFGQKSLTVQAMFKLREIGDRDPEVWEVLLALSKFDGYEERQPVTGNPTCIRENKPEGIWEKPTGKKAQRWQPKKDDKAPALFGD